MVIIKLTGAAPFDDKFSKTIQSILEERLKRRVIVEIQETPPPDKTDVAPKPVS